MQVKVGQIYKGKMSGRKRLVIKQVSENFFILKNLDGIEYESTWSANYIKKVCNLIGETVGKPHPWW